MAIKTKEKIIEDSAFQSSNQSINRKVLYTLKGRKVRLDLCSDSYEIQCYAKAYVFNNLQWELIYCIPHALMKTPAELAYSPNVVHSPNHREQPNLSKKFDEDVALLKDRVRELLDGEI